MKELLKQWFKELKCKHEYEMIEGTCHLYSGGSRKGASFKCTKCGQQIWSDIFAKKVNK
jgi:hypothetical protein